MLAAIAPEEPEHHQASLPLPSAVRKNSPIDSLLRIAPVEFVRNQRRVVDVEESKETLDMANINGAFGTFAKAPDQFTHWMNSLGDVTARLVVLEATGEYESLLVQRLHESQIPLAVVNPLRRDAIGFIGTGIHA